MKYLEIEDLRLSRGAFNLEISLSLDRGQTGVILGPSGCGKTSLLRCIAGLEHSLSGGIRVNGIDISPLAPEKRRLGFVFQDLALFEHLDGRGNLEFGLKLAGIEKTRRKEICDRLAQTLRIASLMDRKPGTMSGGEKQRLAFARALATSPEMLLLDEPLSSLDAPLRKELRRYLRSMLKQEGITALHVTHDVEEALDLGDRLFIMNKGRLVAEGSPSAIFNNPPDAWCVNFLGLGLILSVEVQNGNKQAQIFISPYGDFTLPAKHPSLERQSEPNDVFYFIPSSAVYEVSRADSGKDTLYGTVESISERNGHYRSRLRLMPKENKKGTLVNEDPFIEFDTVERPGFVEGGPGYLRIRPEYCSLLPGSAASPLRS
ncbi:MAG: ABC transporter ATP-binding protein [Spirochaetia bacterium]|nr:ABC transporter ATP-binding protein [Spirochaetia bacterium]